jgi:hypothetical protein
MFLLVLSLGGMRGFEVVWTDLAALCYDMSYCEAAEDQTAVVLAHHGLIQGSSRNPGLLHDPNSWYHEFRYSILCLDPTLHKTTGTGRF